jgi:type IV pilus assembly protein PilV
MIEVLVTIVILAFGLLGLAALQAKIQAAESESYQRAQALLLLQDMADRISANRKNVASYVTGAAIGTGDSQPATCTSLTDTASIDICEWSNELKGAAERQSSSSVGAMTGAIGCIAADSTSTSPPVYRISVAWQGMTALKAPTVSCGQGQFGSDDGYRRAMSTLVTIADLTAP